MVIDEEIDVTKIKIEILEEKHNLTDFSCGNKDIDDFIHKEAWTFQNERLGVSYVFSHNGKVVGFLTLSMADLRKEKMENEDRLQIGKENYPALQISQLATCKEHMEKGIGTYICDFCLSKALEFSKRIGCRLLVLNAVRDSIGFYEKYGFKMLPKQEERREPIMFMNIFNRNQTET